MLNPSAGQPMPPAWRGHDLGGLIEACRQHGVAVMNIRVLAAGVLATDQRHGREAPMSEAAPLPLEEQRARAVFARLGERYGSRAQTALRFALANPGIACVLVGMAELAHLEEALAAAELGPLPEEALRDARRGLPGQLRSPLSGRPRAFRRRRPRRRQVTCGAAAAPGSSPAAPPYGAQIKGEIEQPGKRERAGAFERHQRERREADRANRHGDAGDLLDDRTDQEDHRRVREVEREGEAGELPPGSDQGRRQAPARQAAVPEREQQDDERERDEAVLEQEMPPRDGAAQRQRGEQRHQAQGGRQTQPDAGRSAPASQIGR